MRSLVKLQSEELQVHAGELSKFWRQLEEERNARLSLQKQLISVTNDLSKVLEHTIRNEIMIIKSPQLFHVPSEERTYSEEENG